MCCNNRLNSFCKMLVFLILIVSNEIEGAKRAITQNELLQTQQLTKHLETLKGHLQDTIEKIDHNIRARQAEFETDIQTPDGEYVEAVLGSQRSDLVGAAAVRQIPLPVQTLRNTKNSGLRRRR